MRVLRRTGLAGLVLAAGTLLVGCGGQPAAVHAPAFTVPSPPPFENGERPGTASTANTFLTGWLHGLDGARDPRTAQVLAASCHGDPGCLALVRQAKALPKVDDGDYGAGWTLDYTDLVQADPEHKDSWFIVVRPYWRASETPYDGHDGWATRTMMRIRLASTGPNPLDDWRLWLTPVPVSEQEPAQLSLTNPKLG